MQGAYLQTRKWTTTLAVDYMAHGGSSYINVGTFNANSDADTVVSNSIPTPFIARFIRCVTAASSAFSVLVRACSLCSVLCLSA